jgi:hypothetical protein
MMSLRGVRRENYSIAETVPFDSPRPDGLAALIASVRRALVPRKKFRTPVTVAVPSETPQSITTPPTGPLELIRAEG